MTLKEFFDTLAQHARSAEWRIEVNCVRATYKGRSCCPITFVHGVVNRKHLPVGYYLEAAEQLGLPEPLARMIARTADNRPTSPGEDLDGTIRQSIERAVGLA